MFMTITTTSSLKQYDSVLRSKRVLKVGDVDEGSLYACEKEEGLLCPYEENLQDTEFMTRPGRLHESMEDWTNSRQETIQLLRDAQCSWHGSTHVHMSFKRRAKEMDPFLFFALLQTANNMRKQVTSC